jgi:hypothetical protein
MMLSDLPAFGMKVHVNARDGRNDCSPASAPALQRAQGRARIRLSSGGGHSTRLTDLFQEGCLKVRLPRPLAHGEVDAVVINTSGGLTGGDVLSVDRLFRS